MRRVAVDEALSLTLEPWCLVSGVLEGRVIVLVNRSSASE